MSNEYRYGKKCTLCGIRTGRAKNACYCKRCAVKVAKQIIKQNRKKKKED